jgi:amino-acid N-acetyltransferase
VVSISAARRGDLQALNELLRAEDLHADLGTHPDTTVLVAREDRRVVGGAALEAYGRSGLLRSLVVAPAHRGTGVGRDLVGSVVDEAVTRGLSDLSLLTLTAPGFFGRLGFVRVERAAAPAAVRASHEFAVLCPDTAVAMVKEL